MDCKYYIQRRKELWKELQDIDQDRDIRRAIWDNIINSEELFQELIENPWLLIELQFTVIDKEFNEVPFFLNEVQTDFQNTVLVPQIMEQRSGKRDQIKIKILKGRQQGFTSYITAFQECLALTVQNFAGFTMAHNDDSTKSIFSDIAKGIFDNIIQEVKEKPKKSNSKELIFDGLNSAWRVATAGSKEAGRGKKLRMLHNSEKAFWKDIRKMELGISQALTPTGSIEIDETTANGFNEFQKDWEAIEKGHSKWTGVFYQWFRTSEYRKQFFDVDYTEEEFLEAIANGSRFHGVDSKFMLKLGGLMANGLDINQVHWYYDKRKELKDKLSQEYPCTAKEAFLHSGRPYFDIELLDIQIQEVEGEDFESLHGGEIEIFFDPIPGKQYLMGADVAEGLEERDSSTFCILDAETLEEVANGEYIKKPDEHGRLLNKWARKYNNAFLGVERNNHGHSTLNTLRNDCKYKQLFIEKTLDKKNNKTTDKPGWATTEKSKFIMLDELDTLHREGGVKINSARTLGEMRSVQNEGGKVNINGKDRIVALAIAVQMRKHKRKRKVAPVVSV